MDDILNNRIKDVLPVSAYAEGVKTLLSTADAGRVQTWAIGRGTHVEILEIVDTRTLLEANKHEANTFSQHAKRGAMSKVASVPTALRMKMISEQWSETDLKRWLNDPDNARFRTDGGWKV